MPKNHLFVWFVYITGNEVVIFLFDFEALVGLWKNYPVVKLLLDGIFIPSEE